MDPFPVAVTLTCFSQGGAQGHGAPTLMAGLAPGMLEMPPLEGHCFPQVFISAAAKGNAGISLPPSPEP